MGTGAMSRVRGAACVDSARAYCPAAECSNSRMLPNLLLLRGLCRVACRAAHSRNQFEMASHVRSPGAVGVGVLAAPKHLDSRLFFLAFTSTDREQQTPSPATPRKMNG